MAFKTFQVFPNGNNMLLLFVGESLHNYWGKLWKKEILATLIIKRKSQKCLLFIIESLNNFDNQTFQTSKQKWWGMLTCYYKPPLKIFGKPWLKKTNATYFVIIWKYQNCQKLKTQTSYFWKVSPIDLKLYQMLPYVK